MYFLFPVFQFSKLKSTICQHTLGTEDVGEQMVSDHEVGKKTLHVMLVKGGWSNHERTLEVLLEQSESIQEGGKVSWRK